MNRSAWLVAALLSALAVPALAGVPDNPAPSGNPDGSPFPKHDFTKRPGMPHFGRVGAFLGRAKYIRSIKPTLDELRRDEYEALSEIGLSLYVILREESEPAAEADPEQRAKTDKSLAENRADLAKVRKEIANYQQEEVEREELRSSSILDSKERVKRASAGGFEQKASPPDAAPGGQTSATPAPASGGKTAEEIIREANSLPRAAPLRKRKPAVVPAP
ncbi:MAG: hypothetical protein HYX59_04140 [Elusimicrobia bacterium]|nr:hypothetical protein [Elusimicrobiota bacterium]